MDWVLVLFLGGLLCMILAICTLLISLAKQGDERKNFIQSKAMAQSFLVVVGVLVIYIGGTLYKTFTNNGAIKGLNPFIFLFVISIVFFVALLINKKKYGD